MTVCAECGAEPVSQDELCRNCIQSRLEASDEPTVVAAPNPVTRLIILITALLSFLALATPQEGTPFGAALGWKIIGGGEWWRLLSCNFVHEDFAHWVGNTLLLWIVGSRLERLVGSASFFWLYMTCGMASSIASLIFYAEGVTLGASGAVFGIAFALIVHYASRRKSLTSGQRWRLGFLVFYTLSSLIAGFFDKHVDNPGHVGGVLAGLTFGIIFAHTDAHFRFYLAGAALLLLAAALSIRQTHLYLIPLDRADRALERGDLIAASTELQKAMAIRQPGPLARSLLQRLEQMRSSDDYCSSLPINPHTSSDSADLCGMLQCDGTIHIFDARNKRKAIYIGGQFIADARPLDPLTTRTSISTITMEALDEFDEISCATTWQSVTELNVNESGAPLRNSRPAAQTISAIPASDPRAIGLRQRYLLHGR